ncbi:MAG: TolC family outer membrane protein [Hydrogenophilus sp.]|nr:TolC family outer membrane protein [Hydrogenophilus sp.]
MNPQKLNGGRILLAFFLTLSAASAAAETLSDIYRIAQQNDPLFAAARAAREAGAEKRHQGAALRLPTVALAADTFWNRLEIGPHQKNYHTHQWGVKLTHPLYRPQNEAAAQIAEQQSDLAELEWRDAEQQLILRTAKAWFDLLTARAALEAAEELRAAAEGQLKLAKASFAVGTVTVVDVHEAQSRFDLAEAQVIAARNAVTSAQEALQAIILHAPSRYPRLREGVLFDPPQPDNADAWAEAARTANLAVAKARLAEAIARKELERRRAGQYPAIDLEAMIGNQRLLSQATFTMREADALQVGVKLTLPLYTGGAVPSQIREGAALLTQAERQREAAERQATLSARQSYWNITSGLARIRALEAALESSRKNLEATKVGFEVGVRINLDVLNAQAQLADARTQLAKARFDTLYATLQLAAAAGQLTPDTLAAVDRLFTDE